MLAKPPDLSSRTLSRVMPATGTVILALAIAHASFLIGRNSVYPLTIVAAVLVGLAGYASP